MPTYDQSRLIVSSYPPQAVVFDVRGPWNAAWCIGDAINKYELGQRSIPTVLLIASEVIFSAPSEEMFPALYSSVKIGLAAKALALSARYANYPSNASQKKHALLLEVARGLTHPS
ncbi:MAG: hypothetical protein WDM89_19445 [Rhizomicrobium sp.]